MPISRAPYARSTDVVDESSRSPMNRATADGSRQLGDAQPDAEPAEPYGELFAAGLLVFVALHIVTPNVEEMDAARFRPRPERGLSNMTCGASCGPAALRGGAGGT